MATTNQRAMKRRIRMEFTPMIDVVFLLLIFFMCTLKFKTLENKLATYLPRDKGINPEFALLLPIEKLRLKLSMRGERCICFLNGRCIGAFPEASKAVFTRLNALRKANPESPAEIDPDPRVPHKHVVSLLDECLRSRVKEITFTGPLPALKKRG